MSRLLLLSLFALTACSQAGEPLAGWTTDYEAALKAAKRDNKPLLLDFGATWCGPCKKLEATTFRDKDVAATIESGFVAVKIDVDQNRALTDRHQVTSFPTLVILSPDGREIARRSGYIEAEAFLKWLAPHRGKSAAVKAEPMALASVNWPRCEVVVKVVSNEYESATRAAEERLAERYLLIAGRCADEGKPDEAASYRRMADELTR